MPKTAFFKLSIDKQNKLLDSAKKEFSIYLLSKASINRIIQDINMPRGTFYLYFNDINDLYMYIINSYRDAFFSKLEYYLNQNKGDIFKSYINLFNFVCEFCSKKEEKNLCKNIFLNMNAEIENRLIAKDKPHQLKSKLDEFKKIIDTKNLNVTNDSDLDDILSLINNVTINNLITMFIHDISIEQIKKRYANRINLLKNGMEKKDIC